MQDMVMRGKTEMHAAICTVTVGKETDLYAGRLELRADMPDHL